MIKNLDNKKNHKNFSRGFTLVETLIAIFILTLSITGPIYISSFAFRNTIDSRDNISAQYLAEEVIEVIRNKRDTRILNGDSWLTSGTDNHITGLANCFNAINDTSNKCVLLSDNANQYTFDECSVDCPALSFDPTNTPVYGSSDSTLPKSKFTREFYFQKGDTDASADASIPNKEVKLVVNIKWKERGRDRIYTLTERLYNINYVDFFKN